MAVEASRKREKGHECHLRMYIRGTKNTSNLGRFLHMSVLAPENRSWLEGFRDVLLGGERQVACTVFAATTWLEIILLLRPCVSLRRQSGYAVLFLIRQ